MRYVKHIYNPGKSGDIVSLWRFEARSGRQRTWYKDDVFLNKIVKECIPCSHHNDHNICTDCQSYGLQYKINLNGNPNDLSNCCIAIENQFEWRKDE